jgi:hypothetical protein
VSENLTPTPTTIYFGVDISTPTTIYFGVDISTPTPTPALTADILVSVGSIF